MTDPTRREFVLGALCALCAGCASPQPKPAETAVASAPPPEETIPIPEGLHAPGSQAKATLANGDWVLIWKKPNGGYGAVAALCTHAGGELFYNPDRNGIECSSHGSRFYIDGAVASGPAETPLQAYRVTQIENRLKLQPR